MMKTFKIEIELPQTFIVEGRRGAVAVELDVERASAVIARATLHGFKQKIADSMASAANNCALDLAGNAREGEAKTAYLKRVAAAALNVPESAVIAEALRLAEKVCDTLELGEWGVERQAAGGIDRALIDFVIGKLGKAFAAQMPGWDDAKAAERRGMVDAWLDAKDGRRAAYGEEHDAAEAEARKAVAISLDDL